jgi:hypothetical protein
MNDPGRERVRSVRIAGVEWTLSGFLIVCAAISLLCCESNARGADDPPPVASRNIPALDRRGTLPSAGDRDIEGNSPRRESRHAGDGVSVQYQGTPVAGSRITLGVGGVVDPETTYRWVQVSGPPVALDDPTKPTISLTVPPGTEKLGFELGLAGKGDAKTVHFVLPVRSAASRAATLPNADAGDDQVGLVGHRVTLKGGSRPADERAAFRWFQTGGPKVELPYQDRAYFSFTPTMSGTYRFGLVVATLGPGSVPTISEPDEVLVTVGEPPPTSGFGSGSAGFVPTAYSASTLDQALRAASALGSKATLAQMAEIFEAVSERSSLYTSFAELSSEMMRRLDSVIPPEPNARNLWIQGVFAPLTQHTVSELRSVGLELGLPQSLQQELNVVQKEKLQAMYGLYAREFRSRSSTR